MPPKYTTDVAFVENTTRLINKENNLFVAAHSTVHNNESALKFESFILVQSSFLLSSGRLLCGIQRCPVSGRVTQSSRVARFDLCPAVSPTKL